MHLPELANLVMLASFDAATGGVRFFERGVYASVDAR
jgi:hypothetical protein